MTIIADMETMLVAYADGELDEHAARQVEAYLAANPEAQRALAIHRETASLLRAAFAENLFATPRDLALVKSVKRPMRTRTMVAVAASVLIAMAGYCAGAIWPNLIASERQRMLTEVAEYHSVYSRETVHLVEVPATQSDHLKAWLGKRVNRDLIIPDFRDNGLTFAGGRLVVLDGAPVAELMYTREHGLPIAFCILYREGKPIAMQVERRGNINLATWDDGLHSYIVVGEADPPMIRALAAAAQKQL